MMVTLIAVIAVAGVLMMRRGRRDAALLAAGECPSCRNTGHTDGIAAACGRCGRADQSRAAGGRIAGLHTHGY